MHVNCLIIEDEPIASFILELYIEQTPFLRTASTISRVRDAADFVLNEKPDIVFLDINTKGVDKFQVQALANNSDVLVILTTAYSKAFIEEQLQIKLSGLGYLHKPIRYEDFVDELNRMI